MRAHLTASLFPINTSSSHRRKSQIELQSKYASVRLRTLPVPVVPQTSQGLVEESESAFATLVFLILTWPLRKQINSTDLSRNLLDQAPTVVRRAHQPIFSACCQATHTSKDKQTLYGTSLDATTLKYPDRTKGSSVRLVLEVTQDPTTAPD